MDAPLAGRVDRWFDAYATPGTVFLPLVMVDSGNDLSSGSEDFAGVYSQMVDDSLLREPTAQMTVSGQRSGNLLRFDIRLTNSSRTTLSAANGATFTALVYEEPVNPSLVPVVTAAATSPITSLADGASADFTFEAVVGGLDPSRTGWIVIADYRPDSSGTAYDTLQAVVGP